MSELPLFVQASESRPERYLVVKGSGGAGLGDKIRGLAVGILLARASNRILWVDWADRAYTSDSVNLFPYLFRLAGLPSVENCPAAGRVTPGIWTGQLSKSQDRLRADDLHSRGITWKGAAPPWDPLDAMRRYSWAVDDLQDPADAVVLTTMLSARNAFVELRRRGVLASGCNDEDVLHQCLRDHLRTAPVVGDQVARFVAEHDLENRSVVGIHVRYTDESVAARTMPPLRDYFSAADRMLKTRPDALVFLSTDNSNVVRWFEDRYGPKRVLSTQKWFASPGQPLHKNSSCPDPIISAREAVVDLGLLASCDTLISLGNSSFSIVANALSRAKPSNRLVMLPRVSVLRRIARKGRAVFRIGLAG